MCSQSSDTTHFNDLKTMAILYAQSLDINNLLREQSLPSAPNLYRIPRTRSKDNHNHRTTIAQPQDDRFSGCNHKITRSKAKDNHHPMFAINRLAIIGYQ